MSRTNRVRVAGVGMIPFTKPGQSEDWDVMAEKAIRVALDDAGLTIDDVQHAYAGYIYADSTAGQSALYRVGATGIPVVNVNNNCATGSTALYLGRQLVELGGADCVLAFGFEQMLPGALGMAFDDRKAPMERHVRLTQEVMGSDDNAPFAARFFGGAGIEYQKRYGAKDSTFAELTVKSRRHAANNPFALFRTPLSVEEVLASKHLVGPITRFQACPPTCGAGAAVLVSPSFARKRGIASQVEILAQTMTSDTNASFEGRSMIKVIGYDATRTAACEAYDTAGIGPQDIQVAELHDCFTPNELLAYEALGLCDEGGAEQFILDGENTYGGRVVTNPSGGLLSKGHPLGATGFAQCYELTHQLRRTAGNRQIEGARHALAHNIGLGSACVVTVFGQG